MKSVHGGLVLTATGQWHFLDGLYARTGSWLAVIRGGWQIRASKAMGLCTSHNSITRRFYGLSKLGSAEQLWNWVEKFFERQKNMKREQLYDVQILLIHRHAFIPNVCSITTLGFLDHDDWLASWIRYCLGGWRANLSRTQLFNDQAEKLGQLASVGLVTLP
jgi:hypothetical protein